MSEVAGRHTLKYPIKAHDGDGQLTEVVIRRPLARDYRFMDVGRTVRSQACRSEGRRPLSLFDTVKRSA